MLMDFQTLNRRELQALCKLNKIPANMTNIAMADALKSLEKVEGIEEFLNPSRSQTVRLSVKSPERIEIPHTSCMTSTRKKAKIEVTEALKTPLVSCTKKKDPEPSSFHDVASQLSECEDTAKNFTPTISQVKVAKSSRKLTVRKETITVQSAYSTRRSTRLTAKKSQEKHEVIVLDESDEDSKIEKDVHVDTATVESGEGKVDFCGEVDNLKVKLVEIFGQLDDVDNLKPDSEGICDASEPSKLDNHNVDEVVNAEGIKENISGNTVNSMNPKKQKESMNIENQAEEPQESLMEVEGNEEFLNPSKSETDGLSIESPERIEVASPRVLKSSRTCARKKAKIEVNGILKASVQVAYTSTTSTKLTVKESEGPDVMEMEKSEPVKIHSSLNEVNVTSEKDSGNKCTQEKHDVVMDESDEDSKIEKVVHVDVDTTTLESCGEVDNLNVKSVEVFEQIENVDFEGRQNNLVDKSGQVGNLKPDSVDVSLKEHDVSFVEADDIDANANSCDTNNISKPSKLDNHNIVEVMTAEGIVENISRNKDDFGEAQEMEEIGVGDADEVVTHESVADVSFVEEEKQSSTNANDDVIDHPTLLKGTTDVVVEEKENENENEKEKEAVGDMKGKSLFNNTSLRQLKKRLKATLINSPTSIRRKTEVSDNKENRDITRPEVDVVEKKEEIINEKEGNEDDKAKSLNNSSSSLRQLKKQLKQKYNMDAMPTKMTS